MRARILNILILNSSILSWVVLGYILAVWTMTGLNLPFVVPTKGSKGLQTDPLMSTLLPDMAGLRRHQEHPLPKHSGHYFSQIFPGKIRFPGNGIRERRPLLSDTFNLFKF